MKKIKQRKNPSKTNLSTVVLPLTPHSVLSGLSGYATPGCLRFVFAIFWSVVTDVLTCCTAGLHGLHGVEVAAGGSTLSPSPGECGTGWTAASLSLMVAKAERAWQGSQIDKWKCCCAAWAQEMGWFMKTWSRKATKNPPNNESPD